MSAADARFADMDSYGMRKYWEESSVWICLWQAGNTITVLNYGEYIDTSVLQDFEKNGDQVLYEEATTPEEMYSKYTSSTIPYDLICSSDYMIERLIAEGEAVELGLQQDAQYVNNIGDFCWSFPGHTIRKTNTAFHTSGEL